VHKTIQLPASSHYHSQKQQSHGCGGKIAETVALYEKLMGNSLNVNKEGLEMSKISGSDKVAKDDRDGKLIQNETIR